MTLNVEWRQALGNKAFHGARGARGSKPSTTSIALGLSSTFPGLAGALCSSDVRVARSPVSYFADTFTPGRPTFESFF